MSTSAFCELSLPAAFFRLIPFASLFGSGWDRTFYNPRTACLRNTDDRPASSAFVADELDPHESRRFVTVMRREPARALSFIHDLHRSPRRQRTAQVRKRMRIISFAPR